MNPKKRAKELREELASLQQQAVEKARRTLFRCEVCRRKSQVSKFSLWAVQHYVEPYGCTGGDYSVFGESKLQCPKCSGLTRILVDQWHIDYDDRDNGAESRFHRYWMAVTGEYKGKTWDSPQSWRTEELEGVACTFRRYKIELVIKMIASLVV